MKILALTVVLGASLCFAQRGQAPRQGAGISPGTKAVTFKLDTLAEGKSFDLAEHIGKKPVVLVFGSYT